MSTYLTPVVKRTRQKNEYRKQALKRYDYKVRYLLADTEAELHQMAVRVFGDPAKAKLWFEPHPQQPHYILSPLRAVLAEQLGAKGDLTELGIFHQIVLKRRALAEKEAEERRTLADAALKGRVNLTSVPNDVSPAEAVTVHLLGCDLCRQHPTNLCAVGQSLTELAKAAEEVRHG